MLDRHLLIESLLILCYESQEFRVQLIAKYKKLLINWKLTKFKIRSKKNFLWYKIHPEVLMEITLIYQMMIVQLK